MNRLKQYLMEVPVPANWAQLDRDQFVAIAGALYRHTGAELRARITWALLRISWRTPRRLAAVLFGLSPLDRHQLTALAVPFLEPAELDGTPLPYLTAGPTTLHCAHADLLNEVDTEEWGMADTAFMLYNKRKEPELLHIMASVLYAPPGASREERIKGRHMALFRQVPPDQLLALHLMWTGHRMRLRKDAPWVFRAVNEKKAQRKGGGWLDVMLSMAGGKFGDFNHVKRTPIRVFLRELSHRIEQETRQREQRERTKQRA